MRNTIIVLAIIVVAVIIGWNQVSQLAGSAAQYLQSQGVSNSIGINPKLGQTTCTLKITFSPQLVVAGGASISGFVNLLAGTPAWSLTNGASYSWQNCGQFGNPIKMSWLPWPADPPFSQSSSLNLTSPTKLDIVFSGGQTVHWNLVLQAPDGSIKSYVTDPLCLTLCSTGTIPSGSTYVPKQYTFTFAITNLPRQNYVIQATSELAINGNNAGIPYVQNVSG